MHVPANTPTRVSTLWAQRVIRSFASATNLLVCGQPFIILTPAHLKLSEQVIELDRALRNFGAHPFILPFSSATALTNDALLDGLQLEHPQGLSQSLPSVQALIHVTDSREDAFAFPVFSQITPVIVHAPFVGSITVSTGYGHQLHSPYAPLAQGAEYGRERIAWAKKHMPITRSAIKDLAAAGLLEGRRVGLALVLEPKTAVLALELAAAGAHVFVFGHAEETREDIAAELRAQGLSVFADANATPEQEEALARDFLSQKLEFLLDDGSHLIRMAHDPTRAPKALEHLVGAAEETTSGLRPLRAMPIADSTNSPSSTSDEHPAPTLRIPVIASNDARSKTLFDNAYGTGQSCLLTILDLLDPAVQGYPLEGKHVVVVGYGDVGKGFAHLSAALGGRVSVAERDPVRALQARMDGYPTADLLDLAACADMCVSATGVPDTINLAVLTALPDGAVVSVAGGVHQEVAIDAALADGAYWLPAPGMRAVERLRLPHGRDLLVTDRGGCINCTAGEGNPIEIMDLSFAVQCAALATLIAEGTHLPPGLHPLPRSADDAVAAAALRRWLPLPQGIFRPQELTTSEGVLEAEPTLNTPRPSASISEVSP